MTNEIETPHQDLDLRLKKEQEAIDSVLAFSDAAQVGLVLKEIGYTPKNHIETLRTISEDETEPTYMRLRALKLLSDFITKSGEITLQTISNLPALPSAPPYISMGSGMGSGKEGTVPTSIIHVESFPLPDPNPNPNQEQEQEQEQEQNDEQNTEQEQNKDQEQTPESKFERDEFPPTKPPDSNSYDSTTPVFIPTYENSAATIDAATKPKKDSRKDPRKDPRKDSRKNRDRGRKPLKEGYNLTNYGIPSDSNTSNVHKPPVSQSSTKRPPKGVITSF